MSLEDRTLVVRNISERVTRQLLLELFNQAGPVVNVVLRPDFAFIEFEHKVSVGYALALLEGIFLFERELVLEPKLHSDSSFYSFKNDIQCFNHVMAVKPDYFLQFMPNNEHPNRHSDQRRSSDHERRQTERRSQQWSQRNRYSNERHSNNFRKYY